MRYVMIGGIVMLALCAGCVTRTVTSDSKRYDVGAPKAKGETERDLRVTQEKTLWFWQKAFWQH
jgi:hypothetical protein